MIRDAAVCKQGRFHFEAIGVVACNGANDQVFVFDASPSFGRSGNSSFTFTRITTRIVASGGIYSFHYSLLQSTMLTVRPLRGAFFANQIVKVAHSAAEETMCTF
jgi:hypothetical protein